MQCCREHPIDHKLKALVHSHEANNLQQTAQRLHIQVPNRLVCHDRTLAPPVSLARWSKKIVSDDFSSDESEIDDDDPGESSSGEAAKNRPSKGMKMSAENFAAAEVAVDELWKTCGQSGHMVLTHDGLQKLCEAVQKTCVEEHRDEQWVLKTQLQRCTTCARSSATLIESSADHLTLNIATVSKNLALQ
ncbi:hypothetical protein D6D13_05910 [Aureobasidium pullulans]|uniref:Uncharacterized protein n=1 Tax=Aureobasidium pullulans TaxID=5580 RepID=A0A4S9CT72_AURPU|nr:hypothetical protein D6D13_05910 [Aureobasidium pullulans]